MFAVQNSKSLNIIVTSEHLKLSSRHLEVFLIFLCTVSKAYAVTGADLYGKCQLFGQQDQSSSQHADVQFCGGYVFAAFEFIALEDHRRDFHGRDLHSSYGACFPEGVKSTELIMVYLQYMKEHPTMLHELASIGILNAFVQAYPCRKPSR